MDRFFTGLLAGGAMAALGMSLMMSDCQTRKSVMRSGKKIARKAEDVIDDMLD